jgi:putative transposase
MRLMKENGLSVRPRRRFVVTTQSSHDGPVFANLAKAVTLNAANQLWVADITYIAIASGFVYLAAILDAWSRRVVGYAIGRRIDARLTLAALRAAIASRKPPPGCIHHSDRGRQYAAETYRAELAKHGLKGSMGRRANPYDNAKAESFMKTLKVEEVYLSEGVCPADCPISHGSTVHPMGCTPLGPLPNVSSWLYNGPNQRIS